MQQTPPVQRHRIAPIRLHHALRVSQNEEARRTISAELPTQTTDAIAIRPVVTGKLPVLEPPVSRVIHIASVQPALIDLMPGRLPMVLAGYRMAYGHQYITLENATYIIEDVWADPIQTGKIMALLEREDA